MTVLSHLAAISVGQNDFDIPHTTVTSTGSVHTILQIVFAIAGGVAFLIIIVAGLRFILSQGDPQNVSKARNTIIYAVIGLIICIAAFSIVTFVTGRV